MTTTIRLALCALGITLLMACGKQGDQPASAKTKTALLTSSAWVLKGREYKYQNQTTWTNEYALLPSYDKDDQFLFNASGTYEINEGATRAAPSDPFIIETGAWRFAQNETLLIITKSGSTATKDATIETLSESAFVYTFIGVNTTGTYTMRETYSH